MILLRMLVYCLKGYSSLFYMICHDMLECMCIVGVCFVFFFGFVDMCFNDFICRPFCMVNNKRNWHTCMLLWELVLWLCVTFHRYLKKNLQSQNHKMETCQQLPLGIIDIARSIYINVIIPLSNIHIFLIYYLRLH